MPRSLHVRLDSRAQLDLDLLKAQGLNDSDAVRTALREAADRRRSRAALRAEATALADDATDREEIVQINALMDTLSPPWPAE